MRDAHRLLWPRFLSAVVLRPPSASDSSYPTRPVTLIVPYAAGGVADVGMRIICERLSDRLGQQFIVENRPGAGGIVAAKAGASAAPDGYTLLMTGNNTAIAESLFKSLPYNALTDFHSVSTAAFFDLLIVTRAGSPLQIGAGRYRRRAEEPRQAQYRHHQSRQHAEPRRGVCSSARPASMRRSCRSARRPTWRAPCCAATSMSPSNSMPRSTVSSSKSKIVALASTGRERTAYLPEVPTAIESGVERLRSAELERAVGPGGNAGKRCRHPERRHERGHSHTHGFRTERNRWAWRCAGARPRT